MYIPIGVILVHLYLLPYVGDDRSSIALSPRLIRPEDKAAISTLPSMNLPTVLPRDIRTDRNPVRVISATADNHSANRGDPKYFTVVYIAEVVIIYCILVAVHPKRCRPVFEVAD